MIRDILNEVDAVEQSLSRDDGTHRAYLTRRRADLLAGCKSLAPEDRVFLARHPRRPKIDAYIDALFTDFFEQKGDRQCREDPSSLGGVALYYLGMYNDAFTIRDFWQIRTAGWIGLAAVVLLTAWQVIKATRRSVSVRRAARQAERDEKARQKELEDARSRAYAAGQEDAKAASRVAENASSAADSRENP